MAGNPSFDEPSQEELRRILLSNVQISNSEPTHPHRGHQHGRGGINPPGLGRRGHTVSPISYAGNDKPPPGYPPIDHPFPHFGRGHHRGRGHHFHGRGFHSYRGSHRELFDWRGEAHEQYDSGQAPEHLVVQERFQPDRNMEAFFAQCMYLDQTAEVEIARVEISSDELAARNVFRLRLESICADAIRSSYPQSDVRLHLAPYGSLVSGFATIGADIDVAISVSGSLPSQNFMGDLPRLLESAILAAGHGARVLSRTRVPIIKVCQMPPPKLYDALLQERKKWDDLSEDKPAAKATATSHQKAQTSLEDLHEFASRKRTETDDFSAYGKAYTTMVTPFLDTGVLELSTACSWLVENLPQSVQQIVRENIGFDLAYPPSHALDTIVRLFSSDLFEAKKQMALPRKRDKPWLREKRLGPLDFPKTGVGILCDINFSNELAIHNSRLLYFYSICDARVRPMVLFIKAWTKRRKINSPYSGTLSSYGYVLMIVHFLMNIVKPPVLPNLQTIRSPPRRIIDGKWDVTFFDDENVIRESISGGKWTENRDPLGVLLRNFFHYYAEQGHHVIGNGFNWTHNAISLRTPGGILSKESKGWRAAKTTLSADNVEVRHRYIFAIEDPFELDHNVARTVQHNGIVAIRDEFRRAWSILLSVGYGRPNNNGELFDELVEPEVLDSPKDGEPTRIENSSAETESTNSTATVDTATMSMAALSV